MFMANIYKAMAPFWVEVLILSPEDTAIFLNSRQDKNGEKIFLLARTPVIYEELIEHGVHISEIVLAEKNICHKREMHHWKIKLQSIACLNKM